MPWPAAETANPDQEKDKPADKISARGVLTRFGHLLSAQGVEALASTLFFLYLAWLDAGFYGEIMYALAAGAIVDKVVQFGLYFPLVTDLGSEPLDKAPGLLTRVNIIKLILLAPSLTFIVVLALIRGFSTQMTLILILICLGWGMEALADTFFADLRVRARQDVEARIKIAASLLGYGFGFLTASAGLHPVIIGLYKLISGLVMLVFIVGARFRAATAGLFRRTDWGAVWRTFQAASVFALIEILGTIYNKTNIFFLERAAGVKGVAYYSAAWNLVDPVSILVSQQFLGFVIFPLLAVVWWRSREKAEGLIRTNALWLLAVSLPVMFFLYAESPLLIGIIYPQEYKAAVWMQQYLIWTIFFTVINKLFTFVMMVIKRLRALLLFTVIVTILNLALNLALVEPLGLLGGCLVIILTKLFMALLTFLYCQIKFRFFSWTDLVFPVALALISLAVFTGLKMLINHHAAVALTLGLYLVVLWKMGLRFLGSALSQRIQGQAG